MKQKKSKELTADKETHMNKRNKNSRISKNFLNKSRNTYEFEQGQTVTLTDFSIAQIEGGALKRK